MNDARILRTILVENVTIGTAMSLWTQTGRQKKVLLDFELLDNDQILMEFTDGLHIQLWIGSALWRWDEV